MTGVYDWGDMPTDIAITSAEASQQQLGDNLRTIVGLHNLFPRLLELSWERVTAGNPEISSNPDLGVHIARKPNTILENFDTSAEELAIDVGDGLIIDYGCGKSNLLEVMQQLGCRVLATDLQVKMLEHQRGRGVPTVETDGVHIDVPNDSARVLNASYSQPYWAQTPLQAETFCDELVRVLEKPGGVGLVGPIIQDGQERNWEEAVQARSDIFNTKNAQHMLWDTHLEAADSFITTAFIRRLFRYVDEGAIGLTYFRKVENRPGYAQGLGGGPQHYVPNFVRVETLAASS